MTLCQRTPFVKGFGLALAFALTAGCTDAPGSDGTGGSGPSGQMTVPGSGAGGMVATDSGSTGGSGAIGSMGSGGVGVPGAPPGTGGSEEPVSDGGLPGTGGGGGAGGDQDAGGTGGSGTGGTASAATGCAIGSYLICEDFEAAPLGGTPAGWIKHGDESAVTEDAANTGTKSLELGAIPVWERRIYHDASALGSAHWGRIYFKVQLPVPDAFVHSTLVAFSGVGPTRGASEYRVVDTVKQAKSTPNVGSRIQFLWNVQPQSSGEFGEGTSYDREFDDQWHCAEWHVDASNQSYAFYLDGEELLSFAKGAGNFDGSDIPDSFQELKIGWINYQDSPPGFTAWLDDLALDDQRVGCL